jgi:hypothetical protein
MNDYKSELLTGAAADEFLRRMKGPAISLGDPTKERLYLGKKLPREILTGDGMSIKGTYHLTARNAESGKVDWEHEQDNLITDVGRQAYFTTGWTGCRIGFCPSKEIPIPARSTIQTDGSQLWLSANLGGGVVTTATNTKTFSTTFATPASNFTLGTIFLTYSSGTVTDGNLGVLYTWAYSLLTPPKTQTTVQTLEVVYKISMNPVW